MRETSGYHPHSPSVWPQVTCISRKEACVYMWYPSFCGCATSLESLSLMASRAYAYGSCVLVLMRQQQRKKLLD